MRWHGRCGLSTHRQHGIKQLYSCKLPSLLLLVLIAPSYSRPRVAITTDINLNSGSDPDDRQSLATLFWYADVLDIKLVVPEVSWSGSNGPQAYRETLDVYKMDYWAAGTRFQQLGFPAPSFYEGIMYDRYAGE